MGLLDDMETLSKHEDRQWVVTEPAFSLRDEFAMQFMRWFLSHATKDAFDPADENVKLFLNAAYHYADLAMQAREQKKENDDG